MPKIVDKAETRARICAAALDAFSQLGYHNATMEAIAARLGVAKGTLYLYFPTKEAVATAIVETHFDALENAITTAPPAATLEEFLAAARRIVDIDERHARFVRLFFEVFGPSFASESFTRGVAQIFDRLGRHYAREIAGLQEAGEISDGIDPRAFGRAMVAMLDGLVLHRGIFGIARRRQRLMIEAVLAVLERGLRC